MTWSERRVSYLSRARGQRLPTVVLLVAALWCSPAAKVGAQEESPEEVRQRIEQLQQQQRELEQRLDEEQRELERRLEQAREAAVEAEEELLPTPPVEQEPPRRERQGRSSRSDQKFALGSTIRVREGEVASDILALGGDIEIDGEVLGGAVAVAGGIRVNGRVTGDVIAVGKDLELGPKAEILGDAVSVGGKVIRDQGATVLGRVSEVAVGRNIDLGDWWWVDPGFEWSDRDFSAWGSWIDLSWSLVWTFLLLVLTSLVLLVVPQSVDQVGRLAFSEPFKAVLTGLAVELLFLPAFVVIAILLAISIIGIPLLLFLPFLVLLLAAAALFGFTSMAVGFGRFVKQRFALGFRNRFSYLLVGLMAILSISLAEELLDAIGIPFFIYALFGLFGFLIKYLAWTTGLGAVVLSRFGSRAPALPPPPFVDSGPGLGNRATG